MAVTGKGKQVAAASASSAASAASKGKRPMTSSGGGGERRLRKRRPGVLQFFDTDAEEEEDEEDESDGDAEVDDLVPESKPLGKGYMSSGKAETKFSKGSGKSYPLPFFLKEEDLSDDELEELIKDRYGRDSEYVVYGEDLREGEEDSMKEPPIWRLKCVVGKERQLTLSLLQKFVDVQTFGTKLQIISVFSLDHVKGFVYFEADKACDVAEACKGFCNVYISRLELVPRNEVSHLLSVREKTCEVSKDNWVRMKTGKYKGDLAWVVAVDEVRKRATLKLVPRVDFQAIAQKFGGGISLKQAAIPPPRLISSRELENFRSLIETRRDRETGEVFEILDGMMLKDGYLYKKVAVSSLVYWGVQPSNAELLKFTEASNDDPDPEVLKWISSVYDGHKKSQSSEELAEETPANQGSGFVLYDLVLFGQKSFGVIVAVEKDCFQIMKGDMEVPEVVRVQLQEIKSVCADKMFTASDHHMKTISIGDTVKVFEGPHEGRQGVVRHMYKGTLFICDAGQEENGGFFCVNSKLCENLKESTLSKGVRRRPSFPPQSSTRSSDQPDTPPSFNRQRQNDRDQGFSIGETLRIRKGPLKGYLCRVVGVYRSDVTVKLHSLAKVITVQDDLLCPPKSVGLLSETAAADTFGTQKLQPTEVGEEGAWGCKAPSEPRDQALGSDDAWGSKAASKEAGEEGAWGCKAPSERRDQEPQAADIWGSETSSGARENELEVADAWGSKAATDARGTDDAWGKSVSSGVRDQVPGADAWGSKASSRTRDEEQGPGDAWGSKAGPVKPDEERADPWGSKPASGVGAQEPGSNVAWGSNAASGAKDPVLGADDAWGKKSEPRTGGTDEAWGSKAVSEARGADGAWGSKGRSESGGAADAWGSKAASEATDEQVTNDSWGSTREPEAREVQEKPNDPWGSKREPEARDQEKANDPWGSKMTSGVADKQGTDDSWGSKREPEPRDKEEANDSWGSKKGPVARDQEKSNDSWGSKVTSGPSGSIWNQQRDSDGGQGSSWGSGAGWSGRGNRGSDGGGRGFGGRDGGRGSRDQDGGGRGSTAGGWGSGRGSGGGRNGDSWGDGDQGGQGRGFGGRYGGRGSKDQDGGPSSWSNSGGGWGSGSGRGAGRNGDSRGDRVSDDTQSYGRGRSRGCGRFQSSDQNNDCEKSADCGFSRNSGSSWGNGQSGNRNADEGSKAWGTPNYFGGNQRPGWNHEAKSARNEDTVKTGGVDTSWGSANPNPSALTGDLSNWNIAKDVSKDKSSVWNQNSAADVAGKGGAGTSTGDWSTQKTHVGGNESSGWNNDAGNSWGKPKPWNDRPAGCDAKNEDQSGWNSGRNVCGDQQSGWQGNTSNRGRGRGRNSEGGRFSSWNGRSGNDGEGSGSGDQGEFTGRGRGGRGRWSGEGRGARGGSWNGGQRGRGGNWSSGFCAANEPTEGDGGGNGRTGSWRGGGRGGRGGGWNSGAANCSDAGAVSQGGQCSWGGGDARKESGWGEKMNGGGDGSEASAPCEGRGAGSWGGGDARKGSSWGEKKNGSADVSEASGSSQEGRWVGSWGGGDAPKESGWGESVHVGASPAKERVAGQNEGGWNKMVTENVTVAVQGGGSDDGAGCGSGGAATKESSWGEKGPVLDAEATAVNEKAVGQGGSWSARGSDDAGGSSGWGS